MGADVQMIDGDSQIVEEPDWTATYSDPLDVSAAQAHWRELVRALTEAQTLAPENAAMMARCVNFRIVFEAARNVVAEKGIVIQPRRTGRASYARLSPYWTAMREAAADLDRIEGELGLPPRRRGAVTKIDRKARKRAAADEYLRTVARG